MTAQEAEIYPWTESNPAERLSEEGGSTSDARTAWFEIRDEMENFTYCGLSSAVGKSTD